MQIALLGAECTGKTQLSHALVHALSSEGADTAYAVPEVLRAWCAQHGRTPQPDEQEAIAHEQAQAQRVASALAHTFTVADTTPLMTAVYSDVLFQDPSLYPFALDHQRQYDLTLVMGLDLPWVADGVQRDGPLVRAQVDARLRQVLDAHALRYTVVYGIGEQRIDCALQAIAHRNPSRKGVKQAPPSNWQWSCEKCSDSRCEHQLFSGLLRAPSMRNRSAV